MKLERVSKNGNRYYQLPTGALVPSVTTCMDSIGKPALMHWAAKVEREAAVEVAKRLNQSIQPNQPPEMVERLFLDMLGRQKAHARESAKAAEIGTQAHALIEHYILEQLSEGRVGAPPEASDAAQWAFMAWQDWAKSVNLKPAAAEVTVWSDRWQYAGTADLIAWVDGERTLLDWKTGKAVYAEAKIQNAAYRVAYNEQNPDNPVTRGIVVRLPKAVGDPEPEAVEVGEVEPWFSYFLAAKALWHGLFEKEGR